MKRLLFLLVLGAGVSYGQVVNDLHFNYGDSAHFWINRNQVQNIDLNIDGTHVWDMTVPFGSEKLQTMMVCEVDQGHFGSKFPYAQWVVTNRDLEGGTEYEAYMGRAGNVILLYGYVYNATQKPIVAPYDNGGGDSLYVFPMNIGKQWSNSLKSTVGDTLLRITLYKEIVDTGQVITEVGTFPCAVMQTHMITIVYVFGIFVKNIVYYQYDWLVDSLTSVATVLSRQGESQEIFEAAERTQRIVELWPSGDEPCVVETKSPETLLLELASHQQGIRVRYTIHQAERINLTCYDASGRRLLEKSLQSGPGKHELFLTDLSAGVYFVRLSSASGSKTARGVVIK